MSAPLKLLAAGAGVLLVLALYLVHELRQVAPDAPVPIAKAIAPAPAPVAASQPADPPTPSAPSAPAPSEPDPLPPPQPWPGIGSAELIGRFDEKIPKIVTRNAASCYDGKHGTLTRNQQVTLTYRVTAAGGKVTISDVKVKQSSLKNPELEACFVQQVADTTWTDRQLPDNVIDDELVLSPERGMKKYWADDNQGSADAQASSAR